MGIEVEQAKTFTVRMPDGTMLRGIPEGTSKAAVSEVYDRYPHDNDSLIRYTAHVAKKNGIPPYILAGIAETESGGLEWDKRLKATSPKGARGPMQFMPPTWKQYGGDGDPTNPIQAVNASAKYLTKLYDQFGDWTKTVQAYNAGEGNVAKGIIPAETRAYGPAVVSKGQAALARVAKAPAKPPATAPAKAPTPADKPGSSGILDKIMSSPEIGAAVRGVARGLAMPLTMADDITTQMIGPAPYADKQRSIEDVFAGTVLGKPETPQQKLIESVAHGAGAGLLPLGPVAKLTGAAPTAGALSGGAAEIAKQAGLPTWAQILAGIAVGSGATSTLGMAGRLGKAATAPLRSGGIDEIAGEVLRKSTDDPGKLLAKLEAGQGQKLFERVPVNTAQLANEGGITQLAKNIENRLPNLSASTKRASEIAEAQREKLYRVARPDIQSSEIQARREAVTAPLREQVRDAIEARHQHIAGRLGKDPTDLGRDRLTKPIIREIARIREGAGGGLGSTRPALAKIEQALSPKNATGFDLAYDARKETNKLINGFYNQSGDIGVLDKSTVRHLIKLRGVIDDTIAEQAGSAGSKWGRYLKAYKKFSQKETQFAGGRTMLKSELGDALPAKGDFDPGMLRAAEERGVAQGRIITPSRITSLLKNESFRNKFYDSMTPRQKQVIAEVLEDTQKTFPAEARRSGSDTMRNASAEYAIALLFGPGEHSTWSPLVAKMVERTPHFLRVNPENMERRMGEVMSNPEAAAKVLKAAINRKFTPITQTSGAGAVQAQLAEMRPPR